MRGILIERNFTQFVVFAEDSILSALSKITANQSRLIFVVSESGILQGVLFNVRFKDRIVAPRMAKTYTDVDRGRWVALIDDGRLQIAISFGHAATDISCKEGDVVYIQSQK